VYDSLLFKPFLLLWDLFSEVPSNFLVRYSASRVFAGGRCFAEVASDSSGQLVQLSKKDCLVAFLSSVSDSDSTKDEPVLSTLRCLPDSPTEEATVSPGLVISSNIFRRLAADPLLFALRFCDCPLSL
jgi:hypothetical protein